MIDFGKLQADIVKNIFSAELKHKESDYMIYKVAIINGEEYVPVVRNGVSMLLIPADSYILSAELQQHSPKAAEEFFKDADEEERKLTDTGMIRRVGDKQLKVFETKDGKTIYVDTRLLKPFSKGIRYYGSEKGEMVYIKGVYVFEGLVCAFMVKEDKQ